MPPDMIMQVLRITEQQKSMAMEQVPQRSLLRASKRFYCHRQATFWPRPHGHTVWLPVSFPQRMLLK